MSISVNLTVEIRISIEKDKSEPISNREKVRIIFAWCARQELNLHPLGLEPNGNVTLVEEPINAHRLLSVAKLKRFIIHKDNNPTLLKVSKGLKFICFVFIPIIYDLYIAKI